MISSRSLSPLNIDVAEYVQETLLCLDWQWRITYLNRYTITQLGMPKEALLGRVLWEILSELEGSAFQQACYRAQTEHTQQYLEAMYPSTQRWYALWIQPIEQGFFVHCKNITQHKLAEFHSQQQSQHAHIQAEFSKILAEVTQDYQATLDTAAQQLSEIIGDACMIRLLSADEQWVELVAAYHPNPEILNLIRAAFHRSAYQDIANSPVGITIQNGEPLVVSGISLAQLKTITAPEQWKTVERFPICHLLIMPLRASGRVLGMISMGRYDNEPPYTPDDVLLLRDLADRVAITLMNAKLLQQTQHDLEERLKAEAALRESEARFNGIVSSAMDAIISFDESLQTIIFNTAAEQMFRCSASSIIGKPINQFLPEVLRGITHIKHTFIFDDSETINRSLRSLDTHTAIRADGEIFPIEATISQTMIHGKPLYTVIVRDISERRRLERQFLQAQKMEGIGRLAGGLAHDFNNLLTAIISYAQMLIDDLDQSGVDSFYAKEIEKAGSRAATLTRKLLAFSRHQVFEPRSLSLNDVVTDMKNLLHRLLGEDIDLVAVQSPDLPQILADSSQMEQIIMNLAVNARDAMPNGGKLVIETAAINLDEQYRATRYPLIKTGRYVMLAVSDTGIGMHQVIQERIFEPFFTTKEPGKGTGLGLATVYGIVNQHDGYVWLYSEPGVGTTFKIYFPISTKPSPIQLDEIVPVQPVPASRRRSPRECTVLIVEDEILVRNLIHHILTQAGYNTITAQHGQEALDILATQATQIDVVLTDMIMPQMSGQILIDHIREHWPHLKLICMSGYTDHAVSNHALMHACDRFLQKPFTPESLIQQIDEVFSLSE